MSATDDKQPVPDLNARPVQNRAAHFERLDDGGLRVLVPLQERVWSRWLRLIMPISKDRHVQLDDLGADIIDQCDGDQTLEQIVDRHMNRWQLSFFEARGMILTFMRRMLKERIIVLLAEDPM